MRFDKFIFEVGRISGKHKLFYQEDLGASPSASLLKSYYIYSK